MRKLQQPDGYLSSWYQRMQPGKRWTNLRDCHELYCAGHLIEGAVAYYQATGKRKLLDVMCRYADHIAAMFGPEPGKKQGYCGHEEIELALVKLARVTGERKYMDLAKYFIDQRGQQPHYFDEEARARGADPKDFHFKTYEYNQSHKPVREQDKVVGHAVRAMYLYSGMADIATEYGDDSLRTALDRLWDDLVSKRLYVTGGLGPSADNEGFTSDYDLPNETAYAETCAAVGLVFWASRMLGMGPNARYADIMERALYNGSISGLSLDGSLFFYENPLESRGTHNRWKWHRCPCCPPNIGRMVASIGSYFYGLSEDALAIHLYGDSTARFEIEGRQVGLTQTSRLSMGRRNLDRRRTRRADRIHLAPAHAGLVPQGRAHGERRGGRSGRGHERRLCRDPARVAQRRPGGARSRHGRRPPLCQPGGAAGRRPRSAFPRSADLLRRGDRQCRPVAPHRLAPDGDDRGA